MAKHPKTPSAPPAVNPATEFLEQAASEQAANLEDGATDLAAAVEEALELEREIARQTGALKELEAAHARLMNDVIPSKLDAAGVESITIRGGVKVSIESLVSGTLGRGRDEAESAHERRKAAAVEWLEANGHGGILKRTAIAKAADAEELEKLFHVLETLGVDFSTDETVHPQTLGAFIRDHRMDAGFPEKLFRVSEFRRAKLAAAKTPTRRR